MNAIRLTTPKEKVQQLQEKLCHAAKENSKRKFHALYDKIYRTEQIPCKKLGEESGQTKAPLE